MSNQKITELKSLTAATIDDADLFAVVDVSSTASPTGETKNISTGQLVNRLVDSSIDQINQVLSDTAKLHHSHSIDDIIDLRNRLNSFISSSQIGQPDGVVPLGGNGKINEAYLPDTLTGSNFVRTAFGRTGNVTASVSDYQAFYVLATQVGAANGVAGLDATQKVVVANLPTGVPNGIPNLGADGKVPLSQLPEVVTSSFPVTSFNGRTGGIVPDTSDYSQYYVSQSGGTLTGPLNVLIAPTQPSHSTSKKYVDDKADGYLLKTGGTMSGSLNVLIVPTQPSHSVSKEYVDTLTAGINIGVKKFLEKDVGGGRQSYDGFVFIDKESCVRVLGNNTAGKFGLLQAYSPATTLHLNNNRKADKVYSNQYNTFTICTDGTVFSMGQNNYGQCAITGQTGGNRVINSETTLTNIKKVALSSDTGVYSYMFLTNDGKVYSAGYNNYGQLGTANTTNTLATGPKLVLGPGNTYGNPTLTVTDILSVGGSSETFIALLSNGNVYCVGYGGRGQMGNGTVTSVNTTWQKVTITSGADLTNVVQIGGTGIDSRTQFYALTSTGVLYSWGYNGWGQLGVGDTADRNRATQASTNVLKFWAFGGLGTVFIKRSTDNNIYAAGYNGYGQLGIGSTTQANSFTLCGGISGINIEEVYSGCHSNGPQTTWVKQVGSNTIRVCGHNGQYQHGVGDTQDRNSFVYVPYATNSTIIDINSQYFTEIGGYTIILTADGNIHHTGQGRWGVTSNNGNRGFFSKITNAIIG